MALNELEELAWGMSGMFDESDIKTLEEMFSITRNKDSFDKQFYDRDMQSMRDFISEANSFDSRIPMLEEWLVRKEDEIKSRVVMPPKHL